MKQRCRRGRIILKQPAPIFARIETGKTLRRTAMMHQLMSAFHRSKERARNRRSYRALLELEDHFLQDIGLSRDEVRGMMSSDRHG
jgi:uncharacterized protein YjiS (DUF1127 family)